MPVQDQWRYCVKCGEMTYSGFSDQGDCPAGGKHNHNDSFDYALAQDDQSAPGQHGWGWCHKCQALIYGNDSRGNKGACPAGGDHDSGGSSDYALVHDDPEAQGQNNWRWCNKCEVLFYGGFPAGKCPAGGNHDSTSIQSWNYTIFYIETCNINELAWHRDDNNWAWRDVTVDSASTDPAATGSSSSSTTLGGDPRVYYLDANNHVIELAWHHDSNTWAPRDLTHDVGTSINQAAPGSSLTSTTLGGNPRVYYLDVWNNVIELAWHSNDNHWYWRIVTNDAKPVDVGTSINQAAPGSSLTSTTLGGNPRVYYLDANNHVNELAWHSNDNTWYGRDVTEDATQAAHGSSLTSTTLGGDPRVYYLDANNHVNEMAWHTQGNNWSWRDVTEDAGASLHKNAPGSSLTSTTLGGDPRVYQLDVWNNVIELAWHHNDNHWYWRIVTNDAKPVDVGTSINQAAPGSSLTSTTLDGNPRVYYLDANNHVNELAWHSNDNTWYGRDVTNDAKPSAHQAAPGSSLTSTTLGGDPRVYYMC